MHSAMFINDMCITYFFPNDSNDQSPISHSIIEQLIQIAIMWGRLQFLTWHHGTSKPGFTSPCATIHDWWAYLSEKRFYRLSYA